MGIKKKIKNADGKEFANYGIKGREDEEGNTVVKRTPVKLGAFAPTREAPPRVDLRPYCSPVEDQSQSNSCCANALVGAYEYLAKKAEAAGNADSFNDVSRMFVYYVGRLRDKQIYNDNSAIADEGMTIAGAIDALTIKGACIAENWPFELENINTKPPAEAWDQARNYKIAESREVPVDVTAMKACLAEGYPIVFGLKLTQRFFSPGSSGKIKTPDPDDPQSASHGLHAMLMVGYSDSQEVFIVRNSWGEGWGDAGYCYVPYDYAANEEYNFCGMYAIYDLTETDFTPDDADDEADNVLNDDDDDGDDAPEVEVEEEEYEDFEREMEEEEEKLFDVLEEVRAVFNYFDTDGSGELNVQELGNAMLMAGCFMKKRRLKKYLKKFDEDGSGTLQFEEFIKIPGILPPELAEDCIELVEDEDDDE